MSKFILYTYSMSVWAAVPELALYALSLSLVAIDSTDDPPDDQHRAGLHQKRCREENG